MGGFIMGRVTKAKKGEVVSFRSFEEQLADENKRLKKQVAELTKQNYILRAQLKQPEEGPIWPTWIMKDTVRPTGDKDWPYQGLNKYQDQMIMHHTGRWERLARFIYEQNFGPIPKDHQIYHIDGDKFNNDPENLTCIDKADFYRENYYHNE
jgi:hypothetical protein